jgi:hypothetical protein
MCTNTHPDIIDIAPIEAIIPKEERTRFVDNISLFPWDEVFQDCRIQIEVTLNMASNSHQLFIKSAIS